MWESGLSRKSYKQDKHAQDSPHRKEKQISLHYDSSINAHKGLDLLSFWDFPDLLFWARTSSRA